jgi:hypothetical protein
MITSRTWYIFLIAGLLIASQGSQTAWGALTEALMPSTIAPGERTTLTVRLDYSDLQGIDPADEQSVPELFDEPLNKADGLILLDKNYERTRTQFVWNYRFTAYLPRTYRVPAVEIRFGAQTFSTTARTLTVVAARQENDDELRPEFQAASIPTRIPWTWWVYAALVALVGALAYFISRKLRHKVSGDATEFETPEAWLKKTLEAFLVEHGTSTPDTAAEHYCALLKEYLRRRYLSTTPTMTLRELVKAVRTWEQSKGSPTAELESLMLRIEQILFQKAASAPDIVEKAVRTTEALWLPPKEEHP